MQKIKNIIFDYGGVLFDLDFSLTEQGLSDVLGLDFSFKQTQGLYRTLIQYETGRINTETFIWRIQNKSKKQPQGQEVIKAWNAMLLGMSNERLEFLIALKSKYKVYLLSNINELHANHVDRYVTKNLGYKNYKARCFDKVYYSHEIQLRKPNKNIYRYVMKNAKLEANETLFIDDKIDNVNGAQSVGIHAVQHNPSDEIITKINSYINSIK